ncbi:reticulon-4-interacting protein 1 homolog, mitochondrial isoform X4 [Manihot esculenta]|uniref:reticulon-4-interacting protein 1 homolog, mitochondrial isoform X4 n=1 Tax=Manihot esculenta TaxID=3983 RepID=UPI001CC559A4|nr:reticulon-4-interacting protein 1 homolog, mitochondrial isoform X4 [Manihot esculenta]XP_043804794.1 reticulon-4-interacting protein 1 homolog, mitochondrial isoform X4 [Manihot esculenta]
MQFFQKMSLPQNQHQLHMWVLRTESPSLSHTPSALVSRNDNGKQHNRHGHSGGFNGGRGSQRPGEAVPTSDSGGIICYYCREPRHTKKTCQKLQNKNQRSQMVHTAVEASSDQGILISVDEYTHFTQYQILLPLILHRLVWISHCYSQRQRLLVVGGGGAVGFAAIQLGVAAGCHVATTCGSQSIDRVLKAGAEQAVDYIAEDVELAIKGKFDAVLDTIGVPETERIGINFLKRGGHYMTLQGEAASLTDRYGLAVGLPVATAILLKKQIQYRSSHGIEYWWTYMRADPDGLDEIRRLFEAGKLKMPVERTFPFTQVREAHEAKDKKLIPGKVVLELEFD